MKIILFLYSILSFTEFLTMPKSTEDLIKEYLASGIYRREAQAYAGNFIREEQKYGIKNAKGVIEWRVGVNERLGDDINGIINSPIVQIQNQQFNIQTEDPIEYRRIQNRVVKQLITKTHKRMARLKKQNAARGRQVIMASKFEGELYIKEFENNHIYIPPSDYCFIRCIEKFYNIEIPKIGYSPLGDSLTKLRECTNKTIPDIIRMNAEYKNDEDDDKKPEDIDFKYTFMTMNKKARNLKLGAFILVIETDTFEYHAVLVKEKNIKDFHKNKKISAENYLKIYNEILKNITLVPHLNLSEDQIILKMPSNRPKKNYVYVYDIETSSDKSIVKQEVKILIEKGDEEKGIKNKWETKEIDVEQRKQVPEGLSFAKVYFSDAPISEKTGKKIDIKLFQPKIGLDCYERFLDDVCKNEKDEEGDILIYAHNGGNFDNIFVKRIKTVKFIEQIKTGRIKSLTVRHIKSGKTIKFLDTFCFFQASLKDAANYFKIGTNKIEFDIVNKSHKWFQENKDWIPYMDQDVIVLAKIVHKFERYIRKQFGSSMTTSIGIPSLAWNYMCKTSLGLNHNVYRTKDPTTRKFFFNSLYGGRVLHYKKLFDSILNNSKGLICLDGNSLFPSAMSMGLYPIGKYTVFPESLSVKDYLNNLKQGCLSIVEVTLNSNNQRYPLLPYHDEKGLLIYKSGTIRGVYNSIDIQEALNDGYTIEKFHRGVYWVAAESIFKNSIEYLYNERDKLKKDNNAMEYVLKIILNASYGYLSLLIDKISVFTDNKDKKSPKYKEPSSIIELYNGQFEINFPLRNSKCDKPVHLSSFILSYARKIMNNIMRKVGPENVWYGDTDSIYIPIEKLKDIELSDKLGGVKNDYGDGILIKKAIFLDIKRYLLIFNKEIKGKTYKAKFNGLNFKSKDCLRNFYDGKDKTELSALTKLYEKLYNNPTEALDIGVMQERWDRCSDEVIISEKEMKYQADPSKRYQWVKDISYPLDFDMKKPFITLGPLTKWEIKDAYTHTIFGNNMGGSHLKSVIPLSMNFKDIPEKDFNKITKCNAKKEKIEKLNYLASLEVNSSSFVLNEKNELFHRILHKDCTSKFFKFDGITKLEEVTEKEVGKYKSLIALNTSNDLNHNANPIISINQLGYIVKTMNYGII